MTDTLDSQNETNTDQYFRLSLITCQSLRDVIHAAPSFVIEVVHQGASPSGYSDHLSPKRRDVLRHAQTRLGVPFCSRVGLSKIMIQIILTLSNLIPEIFSEKMGYSKYLPTGNSNKTVFLYHIHRLWLGLDLPLYTIITHLVERRQSGELAQNEIAVVPDFHKRILFSDEAHFWLNGYVNKQNCRIWSEANPQVYVETPLHPEKLTVGCALWAGGILLQKRRRPQRYSHW
ncbi:hypothetical protein TNCV_3499221 [Trichonephila clavipes]|nr:hypothetical protein TNCV_3499221 [Trichonephila clavipes]